MNSLRHRVSRDGDVTVLLTKEQAAYIAGIIDGEGSISLVQSFAKRTNGRYVYPLVRVANTAQSLVDWLLDVVGFGSMQYVTRSNEKCKPVWHVSWAASEAIQVLREVEPYLVIKKDRARIAIDLWGANEKAKIDAGGYFGNGHPLPEWLVKYRLEAFEQVKALNARGVALSR